MGQTNLHVILLKHTPNPEEVVATAAKLCYTKSNIDD
ncbi:MAG: thymidylate synthase (FAD), partial [Nitrospirae bacterium]|nr:thymidylate synthase (FAD) [Nitrospirota bacterium]